MVMRSKSRKKYVAGSIVIVIAVSVLIFNALSSCSIKSYTVSDLLQKGDSIYGKTVQVEGEVAAGSIIRESGSLRIDFVLLDENDTDSIAVSYDGKEPDNFHEQRGVSLKGKLDDSGRFIADEILTKCASKYVPEE